MTHGFNSPDAVKVVEGELLDKVEAKVKASTTAATVTGIALAEASLYLFHGGPVPGPLAAIITAVVGGALTGLATFITGYRTRHTPRTIAPGPSSPPATGRDSAAGSS